MAVSQMEKISVIGPIELEKTVLQVMQGQRVVELLNATQTLADDEQLAHYSHELEDQSERHYRNLLKRLQDAQTYLKNYSSGKEQTALKRTAMTLDELEHHFDEEKLNTTLGALEKIIDQLDALHEERNALQDEEKELARWQYLDVTPKAHGSQATRMEVGVLNNKNQTQFLQLLAGVPELYYEEVYQSPHHIYYFLLYLQEFRGQVSSIMEKVSFKRYDYPYDDTPKKMYRGIQEQMKTLADEEKATKKKLVPFSHQLDDFALAEEAVLALIEREKVQHLLVRSESLFVLVGWLPEEDKDTFLAALSKKVPPEDLVVTFTAPDAGEEVPVKLHNNPLVAPFELLTEMYSLPKYGEVDPTPLMTPFYLVFFGMMVADIGYGLFMLVATLIAKKLFVFKRGMARFVNFFFILSIPTIIWGVIYGSFFGMILPEKIFGISQPFPLLSTTKDVNSILILSVVFGFLQIMFGLVVNSVLLVKKKEYLNSVKDGFAWQGLLVGIAIAGVGKLLFDNAVLFNAGLVVAILCAASILIIPIVQTKNKGKGLAKGIYGLYGITNYVGDLVSYTRLMALGIAGGSIGAAFNMLVGYMPVAARFSVGIVLIIALHAINLLLSLLSAFVHGARLQYVEFFGKFFTGGGKAFKPLETSEKYINIESENTKEKSVKNK